MGVDTGRIEGFDLSGEHCGVSTIYLPFNLQIAIEQTMGFTGTLSTNGGFSLAMFDCPRVFLQLQTKRICMCVYIYI